MPQITIDIAADNTELKKQIAEAEIELKGLRREMQRKFSIGEVDAAQKIQIEVNQAKTSLKGLQGELAKTSQSNATFAKSSANGGNALMQFSRIAQDAPFGIMGIGNNITATAEAFGHLSTSSGGTGNALKAVASSMLGTGGILLAVSLVTSALTYMSQNGITVGDVFDKLSGTFDEFGNSIKKANEEAVKSSSSQIATFKAYVSAAQDVNLSLEHRLIAVEKLRKIAPYHLKDLNDEKVLNGDLSKVIGDVTAALLAQARAKAYGSILDETSLKQVKLYTEIQKDLNKAVKDFKIPASEMTSFQEAIKGGTGALMRYLTSVKKAPITPSDFIDFNGLENLGEKYKELGKLNGKAYKLGTKIGAETKAQLSLDYTPPPKTKDTTKKRDPILQIESYINKFDEGKARKELEYLYSRFGNAAKDFKGEKIEIDIPLQPTITGTEFISEELRSFNESANSLIQGAITETFYSLGESIGGALVGAGDGLKSAGNAILGILGSFMKDYGKLMIATGVGLLVSDMAIKSNNPYAMIAGGVALVAVGAAFASKSKAMRSNGTSGGGDSTSSRSGSSQQSSGSSYASPSSGMSSGGTVVFEISGQSLIGVLSNTLDKNTKLGGSLGLA